MKRNGTSLSCSASSMACGEIGRERSARSQSQPSSARPRRALAALSPRSRRALAALSPRPRRALAAISPRSRRALAGISPASRRHLAALSPASRRHLGGICLVGWAALLPLKERLPALALRRKVARLLHRQAQAPFTEPTVEGRAANLGQSRPISGGLGRARASSCELGSLSGAPSSRSCGLSSANLGESRLISANLG